MDFYAVLDQVLALLRQRQRVTYRALKVQFQLDDESLEALRDELIEAQHLSADEAGKVLVRTGEAGSSSAPTSEPVRASHAYTPPYLAARMELLATPGSRMLPATTLRLVEGLVRVNALGPVPVKGLTEPVEVFELVGVTALRRYLQAAARELSRFVGRDHDLESLPQ